MKRPERRSGDNFWVVTLTSLPSLCKDASDDLTQIPKTSESAYTLILIDNQYSVKSADKKQ